MCDYRMNTEIQGIFCAICVSYLDVYLDATVLSLKLLKRYFY